MELLESYLRLQVDYQRLGYRSAVTVACLSLNIACFFYKLDHNFKLSSYLYILFHWLHLLISFQDNVFVTVVASIQYRALAEKASDAYYKLSNTTSQIQAYVFDGMMIMLT